MCDHYTYSGRLLLGSRVCFLTIAPTVVPYVLRTVGPAVVDPYWVLIVYLSHLHLQQSISCGFPHVYLTVAPTVVDLSWVPLCISYHCTCSG